MSGPRPSLSRSAKFSGVKIPKSPGSIGEVVDVDHAVVLEVPADGKLVPDGDPERLELLREADSGQHQKHRRLVRPAGDDHLALGADGLADAAAHELDADGTVALEDEPLDEHSRDDLEVRPALRRMEERVGGGAAQAVPLRELEARDALRAVDVQVRDVLVARLHGCLEHQVGEARQRAAVRYRERPADAVERVLPTLVVLGPLEVRQDLVVGPARAAVRRPAVEVGAVAAQVDHRVDRAGAADHAPARKVEAASAEPGLGLAEEIPVEARLEDDREHRRHVDLRGGVRAAGLQELHGHVGVLGETGGEHAARRPGADDHVIRHGSAPSVDG